jgi:hypothetical protein
MKSSPNTLDAKHISHALTNKCCGGVNHQFVDGKFEGRF